SFVFFFSSRRRHTRCYRDWSSDVCSSDLTTASLTNVSAASFSAPVAPEMIISAFGSHLANETKGADYTPLPNSLGNTTVKVKDRSEERRVGKECRTRWWP